MADGADVTVVVDDADLQRAMATLTPGGLDLPGMFGEMADDFYAFEGFVFDSIGGSRGTAWDPNSPGYAAKKRANYGDLPVLQLTGALYRAMTHRGSAGGVLDIQPLEMTIGTDLPYADKHQRGSTEVFEIGPPFNMTVNGVPARPFAFFETDDVGRWETIAYEWLAGVLEKGGV